ncbi:MAG: glycosyltransferase family 4 protein [Anaerolineales bacterium]|nr:glycosyltransferase family 4 protein [Anaerolineales bacterium]
MHILLIHQAFAALDEPGGTRHHELARQLAGRGHRVTVITSPVSYLTGKSHGKKKTEEKVKFHSALEGEVVIIRSYVYPALHRSFIHRMINFFSFMASSFIAGIGIRHVDLVWGTSPPIFQGITAWLIARLKGIPFLFEVRDLWPAFAVGVGVLRNRRLIKASEWLEMFLYRHADRVVVNSPGFIPHVKKRGARHIDCVPNGADTEMFNPQSDGYEFKHTHQLEGKFIVLYAGAHGMSNNLDVVLEAAKELQDQSNLVFVFLGDGKEKISLVQKAEEMALPNVCFVPPVPKIEMPEVLAAANACIAILKPISLYGTVYPNKVFDYMAAGRPVLLAIDGVIRVVVETAGAGIFVQPGDSQALVKGIQYLLADPRRGKSMGQNGRLYVQEHFDRKALANQMAGIIEEMGEGKTTA